MILKANRYMTIVWQPKISVYYKKIISRSISLSENGCLAAVLNFIFCTSQCFLKGWFSSKAGMSWPVAGHCFLRLRKKKQWDQIYLLIILVWVQSLFTRGQPGCLNGEIVHLNWAWIQSRLQWPWCGQEPLHMVHKCWAEKVAADG